MAPLLSSSTRCTNTPSSPSVRPGKNNYSLLGHLKSMTLALIQHISCRAEREKEGSTIIMLFATTGSLRAACVNMGGGYEYECGQLCGPLAIVQCSAALATPLQTVPQHPQIPHHSLRYRMPSHDSFPHRYRNTIISSPSRLRRATSGC